MIFKLSAIVPLSSYFDDDIDALFILSRFMLVGLWVNRLATLSRLSPWVDGTGDIETRLPSQQQAPTWLPPLALAHLITFSRAPVWFDWQASHNAVYDVIRMAIHGA
jgi:hypothetical protein